jgi:hypothetical protein
VTTVLYSQHSSHTYVQMKATYVLFALVALLAVAFVAASELEAPAACHPQCRWQCDDPQCPAQCHPVCERPKCQVHCEETPCAACKIHCDKPQCNVRCPKDLCESTDCPKCETVCAPAKCRTACTAPNAVCTPMCEETKCDWKCKKPTLCPRPKCELVCEKPACAYKKPVAPAAPTCCPCTQANIQASMIQASENSQATGETPSFLELTHHFKFQQQETGAAACCACKA